MGACVRMCELHRPLGRSGQAVLQGCARRAPYRTWVQQACMPDCLTLDRMGHGTCASGGLFKAQTGYPG